MVPSIVIQPRCYRIVCSCSTVSLSSHNAKYSLASKGPLEYYYQPIHPPHQRLWIAVNYCSSFLSVYEATALFHPPHKRLWASYQQPSFYLQIFTLLTRGSECIITCHRLLTRCNHAPSSPEALNLPSYFVIHSTLCFPASVQLSSIIKATIDSPSMCCAHPEKLHSSAQS
jgi:hypothetical protein